MDLEVMESDIEALQHEIEILLDSIGALEQRNEALEKRVTELEEVVRQAVQIAGLDLPDSLTENQAARKMVGAVARDATESLAPPDPED